MYNGAIKNVKLNLAEIKCVLVDYNILMINGILIKEIVKFDITRIIHHVFSYHMYNEDSSSCAHNGKITNGHSPTPSHSNIMPKLPLL